MGYIIVVLIVLSFSMVGFFEKRKEIPEKLHILFSESYFWPLCLRK